MGGILALEYTGEPFESTTGPIFWRFAMRSLGKELWTADAHTDMLEAKPTGYNEHKIE
jgi:hypothetical protein